MQQFELLQALDDIRYVKKRLTNQAEAAPLSQRRALLEMSGIIDRALVGAYEAGTDDQLTFPVEEFLSK